jgi:hypothetical protein
MHGLPSCDLSESLYTYYGVPFQLLGLSYLPTGLPLIRVCDMYLPSGLGCYLPRVPFFRVCKVGDSLELSHPLVNKLSYVFPTACFFFYPRSLNGNDFLYKYHYRTTTLTRISHIQGQKKYLNKTCLLSQPK